MPCWRRAMRSCIARFLLSVATISLPLYAMAWQSTPAAQSAAASELGMRAEFLPDLKSQEDRFVSLAQAIPADKYTWRPAEGVRSISEVFLHVAAANFNLPKLMGVQPPAGFKVQGFEKSTTDKAKVIQSLQDAFAHMRNAVQAMPDSDVEK